MDGATTLCHSWLSLSSRCMLSKVVDNIVDGHAESRPWEGRDPYTRGLLMDGIEVSCVVSRLRVWIYQRPCDEMHYSDM